MDINELQPGRALYDRVRAAFILKGTTMEAWCRKNKVARQNAICATVGSWNGPKGKAVRRKIIEDSGVAGLSFNPPESVMVSG